MVGVVGEGSTLLLDTVMVLGYIHCILLFFLNIFSKSAWPIQAKFYVELLGSGGGGTKI